MKLLNKVAFVTGAGQGMGQAIVRRFVAEGAKVVAVDLNLPALAESLADLGDSVLALACNVADSGSVADAMGQTEQHFGGLDILVNNAGASWGAPFDKFPETGWDKVVDLNLKSPFFLTQALHGALKAAASHDQPAKVINICSIDGIRLNPQETYSYHASKSGLIYLTRRIAAELIKDSINVTGIAPGAFASEMNRVARDQGEAIAKHIPSRRIGRDEDMAAAAIYLASRAGDYVVGETIAVDGGVALATTGGL